MAKEKEKEERIISLLTEVVTSVCKGQLDYLDEIHIEGLLAVTLDHTKVLLLNLNQGSTKQLKVASEEKDDNISDISSRLNLPFKLSPADQLCSTLSKNIEQNESRKRPFKRKIDYISIPTKKICTETSLSEMDNTYNIIDDKTENTIQCQVVFMDESIKSDETVVEFSSLDDSNVSTTEIIATGDDVDDDDDDDDDDESISLGQLKVEKSENNFLGNIIQSHQIDHQYVTLSNEVTVAKNDEERFQNRCIGSGSLDEDALDDEDGTTVQHQLSKLAHLLSNSEPYTMNDFMVNSSVDCAIIEGGTASSLNKPKLLDVMGYHYSLKNVNLKTNKRYWRCVSRNSQITCYATIIEGNGFVTGKQRHLHDPPPFDLLHLLITTLKHECRAIAQKFPQSPNKDIIQEVMARHKIEDTMIQSQILKCKRLHRSISAERLKLIDPSEYDSIEDPVMKKSLLKYPF